LKGRQSPVSTIKATYSKKGLRYRLKNNFTGEEHDNIDEIPVIFDQLNHHEGSIYCIDWTECERLVASGSNDKKIKILVCPPLNDMDEGEESDNLLELTLSGHQGIVRTLCFHPKNELNLISGGEGDSALKIWDTETGNNILNLEGHQNGIFCIRPTFDGSFFASVGKDTFLKVWDIRAQK
jgi:WD40 repeat protein